MTEQVTLTLPSNVYKQAEALARRVGRPVNDLLAETIELTLSPLAAEGEPRRTPGPMRRSSPRPTCKSV